LHLQACNNCHFIEASLREGPSKYH